MHVDFRFHSASAPPPRILLTTVLPAEANEGTAVFCDPSRLASIGVSIPQSAYTVREHSHQCFRCDVPEPEAAQCGLTRQLYVDRTSNIPALYGGGWQQVVEIDRAFRQVS